MVKQM